jgi:hypothetical protein
MQLQFRLLGCRERQLVPEGRPAFANAVDQVRYDRRDRQPEVRLRVQSFEARQADIGESPATRT